MFWGPPCWIVYRDMPLEQNNYCWLNYLDKFMYEIIMTIIKHHMLIVNIEWEPSQVFCPLFKTVTQSWTGSSRNHSSINMYLHKLKYGSVFVHFGGISPLILNLDIRWRSVVSFTPRHFSPCGKTPCFALNGRRSGPQNQSGCFWSWEKSAVIVVNQTFPHLSNLEPIFFSEFCGYKIKRQKFQNYFTNWGNDIDSLAQVLDRRTGSDSEVCCSFADVK